MTGITVRYRGADYSARIQSGENWRDAAERALKRAAGRSASVRGWILENWETDRNGVTTRRHFKATVCGRSTRTGDAPILGEARVDI